MDTYKEKFKTRMATLGHEIYPYVVVIRDIDKTEKCFLIVNDNAYEYSDLVQSIVDSFKVSTALHCWSQVCDFF